MAIALGKDGLLAVSATAFSEGTPSYSTVSGVTNVDLGIDVDTDDVTTRGSGGFRAYVPTLKDVEITLEMPWDTAATGYLILRDSWVNGSPIAVKCYDGTVVGTAVGVIGDFYVTKMERSEPLDGAMRASVTLKPAPSTTNLSYGVLA